MLIWPDLFTPEHQPILVEEQLSDVLTRNAACRFSDLASKPAKNISLCLILLIMLLSLSET